MESFMLHIISSPCRGLLATLKTTWIGKTADKHYFKFHFKQLYLAATDIHFEKHTQKPIKKWHGETYLLTLWWTCLCVQHKLPEVCNLRKAIFTNIIIFNTFSPRILKQLVKHDLNAQAWRLHLEVYPKVLSIAYKSNFADESGIKKRIIST